VSFNDAATRVGITYEGVGEVLFEGKLGTDRKGRAEYENQAGDRSIVLWERANPPTQVFLSSISFSPGSCLFVVPGGTVGTAITAGWDVPVLTVTDQTFTNELVPKVKSHFTEDSNALPPVYLRVCSTASPSSVQLVLSDKVICHSFDTAATRAGSQENAGEQSPGLTGVIADKPEIGTKLIRVTLARPFSFVMFEMPQADAGRGVDAAAVVPRVGGAGGVDADVGIAAVGGDADVPGVGGASGVDADVGIAAGGGGGFFGMPSAHWHRFLSLLRGRDAGATQAYVSVRYSGA
jgi:hypothetical protein